MVLILTSDCPGFDLVILCTFEVWFVCVMVSSFGSSFVKLGFGIRRVFVGILLLSRIFLV